MCVRHPVNQQAGQVKRRQGERHTPRPIESRQGLRAGEAMSALWLRATQDRMAVLPLSQIFEVESTRTAVRDGILGGLAVPHLLLRLGWPGTAAETLPPTPRRRVDQLLVP